MKSILIDESADKELDALKNRLNRPKKQIVEQLIRYAYSLKIDPAFVKEGDPSHEIRKTRDDLVGFIKRQEKDHLKPLYDQLRLLVSDHQKTAQSLLTRDDYKGMEKTMVENQRNLYISTKDLKQLIESNDKKHHEDSDIKQATLLNKTKEKFDVLDSNLKARHEALLRTQDAISRELTFLRKEKADEIRRKAHDIINQFISQVEAQKNMLGYNLKSEQLAYLKGQIDSL